MSYACGMRILGWGILVLALACGDDDGVDTDSGVADVGMTDDAGGDDAGGDDAGGDDAGDDAGADDAGADDAGDDDAGADDAGVDDAGTTDVSITVDDAAAWANCMPIVPEDPLRFFLTLSYDNSGGAAEANAVVTSATLAFDDPDGSVTTIAFDVEDVTIAAGATLMQTHSKTTSTPIVPSCAICSSERMVTYNVTIEVDSVPVMLNGTISFGCTF